MAETGGSGGGAGKGTMVAIATAIIGGITTIIVAFINRPDPQPAANNSTPSAEVERKDEGAGANPAKDSQLPPMPALKTPEVINVAGMWTSADGESLQINQAGTQLTVAAAAMTGGGPFSAQGTGQIQGRDVTWTVQASIQGNLVEMDCSARVTTAGNSLQGSCNAMGSRFPFIYNR